MKKEFCLVMKVASCSFLFLYIRPINCCSMVKLFFSGYGTLSNNVQNLKSLGFFMLPMTANFALARNLNANFLWLLTIRQLF